MTGDHGLFGAQCVEQTDDIAYQMPPSARTDLQAAIRRHTDTYLDCHLMMTNPGDYLADRIAERENALTAQG